MNKNCLAIHDICSFSKSSLTVVIPIMESLNIEVCPIPSAILSTQTDGYNNFYFNDLSDSMESIFDVFKKENFSFNSIYSGFLSDFNQISIVKKIITYYKTKSNPLIVIDPVMGDNKVLYPTIDERHLNAMKDLISLSDIITPNITEAALLVGKEPKDFYEIDEIKEILQSLTTMGPKVVIITSIKILNDDKNYIASIQNKNMQMYFSNDLKIHYPGCGDLFTSTLTSKILNGKSIEEAVKYADNLCHQTLINSKSINRNRRQGISTIEALKLIHFSN
jgi:pyridoxine kinase